MEPLGNAETPTVDTPSSDTPTAGTPTPGTPTPITPTPDTSTSDTTPTPGAPDPSGPGSRGAGGGSGEEAAPHDEEDPGAAGEAGWGGKGEQNEGTGGSGGKDKGVGGEEGDAGGVGGAGGDAGIAKDVGGDAGGSGAEAAGGSGGAEDVGVKDRVGLDVGSDAGGAGGVGGQDKGKEGAGGNNGGSGDAGGDARAEADSGSEEGSGGAQDVGGDARVTGSAEGDAKAEGPEDAGGDVWRAGGPQEETGLGSAAAGSARGRQEPAWLQDEDDELWPEFPPCSPTGEPPSLTSPLSPTTPTSPLSHNPSKAGTTEGLGGSERSAPRGPRGLMPPRIVRPEGAGGRPRASNWAQGRSAILEKFGGAAKSPAPHLRRSGGAATVKAMLLEWCRARTRGYQHVDVHNFSGSWASGLAFCALLHSFFPNAFDYAVLQPDARRHNFTLAFTTAEEHAGCAQLLDVEDMVRLAVPDAKCIYTYVQELYRCLVAKGLVRTRKR